MPQTQVEGVICEIGAGEYCPVINHGHFRVKLAPKNKAVDRSEVIAVSEKVSTPAGVFENCVHTLKDRSRLEAAADHKFHAPGVELVKDGDLLLVKVEK